MLTGTQYHGDERRQALKPNSRCSCHTPCAGWSDLGWKRDVPDKTPGRVTLKGLPQAKASKKVSFRLFDVHHCIGLVIAMECDCNFTTYSFLEYPASRFKDV
jgi:hypothetical protein